MGDKSSEIAIQSNYKMRQLYNDMQLLKMYNGMFDEPRETMSYLTSRSNLLPNAFKWENV